MEGKGPSSLPCLLARDGDDSGFMSLPMGELDKVEAGKVDKLCKLDKVDKLGDGGQRDIAVEGDVKGGIILRGAVWVLHERLLASWKQRWASNSIPFSNFFFSIVLIVSWLMKAV